MRTQCRATGKVEFVLVFVIMVTVVTYLGPQAGALPAGEIAGWAGQVDFDFEGLDGRMLTGYLEYAVYTADNYPGYAPGDGEYIYAYEIFNRELSDIAVESLSICILQGADTGQIRWDDYESQDGVVPFYEDFFPDRQAPDSAKYLFMPYLKGLVGPGQHSVNLLFSGNDAPTTGWANIEGGAVGGMVRDLPTPGSIPEPASLALFAAVAGLLARARPLRSRVRPEKQN